MRKIKLFIYSIATTVFMGCDSPHGEPFYLISGDTGFIHGPIVIKDSVPIKLGDDEYYLAHPNDSDLAVLTKLRTKRVQVRASNIDISEFITALNDAQMKQGDYTNTVKILLHIPPSWDAPITYSDAEARLMGYDKGFSTSGRASLPLIQMVTDGDVAIYDVLQQLRNSWGVQFHFNIIRETVVLQVVDYRGAFREYYPLAAQQMNDSAPLQTGKQNGGENVIFPH